MHRAGSKFLGQPNRFLPPIISIEQLSEPTVNCQANRLFTMQSVFGDADAPIAVNSRKNQIYKAFREVGRVMRTVALLRFWSADNPPSLTQHARRFPKPVRHMSELALT